MSATFVPISVELPRQAARQAQVAGHGLLDGRRGTRLFGCIVHGDGQPVGAERRGHPLARADNLGALVGLGPTQTSNRSVVAQGAVTARSCRAASTSRCKRLATWRSDISRNATRLPL